jgi:hypothetical protein
MGKGENFLLTETEPCQKSYTVIEKKLNLTKIKIFIVTKK